MVFLNEKDHICMDGLLHTLGKSTAYAFPILNPNKCNDLPLDSEVVENSCVTKGQDCGNLCFLQIAIYPFHILRYSYDLLGGLVLIQTHILRYSYDLLGGLVLTQTDPFHILRYSYDLLGHAQMERCELVLTQIDVFHFPYDLVGHAQMEK